MAAFDTAIGRAPSVRLLAALFALSLKWPPVLQMQKGAGVVLAPNARFRNTARLPVFEDTETLFEAPLYLENLQHLIADDVIDNNLDIEHLARELWVNLGASFMREVAKTPSGSHKCMSPVTWMHAPGRSLLGQTTQSRTGIGQVYASSAPGRSLGVVLPANCYSPVPTNEAAFVTGGSVLYLIQGRYIVTHVMAFFIPIREQIVQEPGHTAWRAFLQTALTGFDRCVHGQISQGGVIDLSDVAFCVKRYLLRQTYGPHRGILVLAVPQTRIGFQMPLGGLMIGWEEILLPSPQGDATEFEEGRRIVLHIMPPRFN